jgi:hypothetical protein
MLNDANWLQRPHEKKQITAAKKTPAKTSLFSSLCRQTYAKKVLSDGELMNQSSSLRQARKDIPYHDSIKATNQPDRNCCPSQIRFFAAGSTPRSPFT